MIDRLKNIKAFTVIELIVVIAVIGILALLAAPKFLGYTEKAKVAQVKSEIVAREKIIDAKRVEEGDKFIESWQEVEPIKIAELKAAMFNKRGILDQEKNNEEFDENTYYKIPGNDAKLKKLFARSLAAQNLQTNPLIIKTNLPGNFYLSEKGKVFYYDEELAEKVSGHPVETPGEPGPVDPGDGDGGKVDPGTGDGDSGTIPDPPKEPSLDDDFEWIASSVGYTGLNGQKGYFRYKGTGKTEITIPNVIQGVNITSYYKMFDKAPAELTKVISNNPKVVDASYMFVNSNMPTLDLSELNTSSVTNMKYMFSQSSVTQLNLKGLDTSKVTNMSGIFNATVKLTSLDLSGFNTSSVTDMSRMFYFSAAKALDLKSFNTSNVTTMSYMFFESKANTMDLSSFNTINVTDMEGMFCQTHMQTLDLRSFNTSKVTTMIDMFAESEFVNLNVSSFDTSNVTDMVSMFKQFKGTTLDLSSFRTPKVKDFGYMFAESNLTSIDLSTFDTSTAKRWDGNNFRNIFQLSKLTKAYAGTQTDADNFNSGTGRPTGLTVTVK